MNIRIFETKNEIAQYCADVFEEVIHAHSRPVLGLATGASPIETYALLVERYKSGRISFRNVTTFNLDEYCGLPTDDPNSYISFMRRHLFDLVDISPENIHIPNGNADPEIECARYDEEIKKAGGIDLQLLGVGRNGHIGFNEPAPYFSKGTHAVQLTQSTIDANAKYFQEGRCPTRALTMGIGSIFSARKIVLIATGDKKADAVYNAVHGNISPMDCPASVLQLHPDVTFLLDRAAAAKL